MLPRLYRNVPRALALIRELRGHSQSEIARRAGIGKSRISKYEGGKDLPRLDTLANLLSALEVGIFEFWYTVYLIDLGEEQLDFKEETGTLTQRLPPLPISGPGLLSNEADTAFKRLMEEVMKVYHQMNAEKLRDLQRKN